MSSRILVVDDDPVQCRCVAIGLKVEGFEVLETTNAERALEELGRSRFDAVVVDLMMPGINGLQMCRLLKTQEPDLPVVLTSGYHVSQRQLDLAGIGHALFVPKPFSAERLARILRTRLAQDRSPSTSLG